MPRYDYDCNNCGGKVEIIKSMSSYNADEKCPICDATMTKQMSTGIGTPNRDYSRVVVSHSLGMCPTQIAEHNRLFPDIKVRADGVPVFENFKAHDDYCKKTGVEKAPQRNRPQTRKVIKANDLP